MNYDVYIEENEPVRLISDIINEIYFTEEYTVTSEWDEEIPEDVLMRILIYGYMNGAYSSRKIEELCKRDLHFLWLLDGFKSPDHCMIAREAKTVTVSHKFKALRDESLANITTDLGKRLRMNRSIQTMV